MGKGDTDCYEQFLLFPVFSKDLYYRHVKQGVVWEKVNVKTYFSTMVFKAICDSGVKSCVSEPILSNSCSSVYNIRRQQNFQDQIPNVFKVFRVFLDPLNSFLSSIPNETWFACVCNTSLLKTLWETEKLLITSNFSFSHSVFYPFGKFSAIFIEFKNCRLQSLAVWNILKLLFGKGLKSAITECTIKQSHAQKNWI